VLRVELQGDGRGAGADWRIETTRGECRARPLAVATAINRAPHEAAIAGRENFAGRVLHSVAYRKPRPFAGQRVLVVGSGNSAAEIALDLVGGGAASVSMWVRGARHFISLRSMRRAYRVFRALGQMTAARMDARHQITWGAPAFDAAIAPMDKITNQLSMDLARFGIRKPTLSPGLETFTNGRIPVYDVGTADAIRNGRIRVIDGNARPIEGFECDGVRLGGARERFDVVILATGFQPKLEDFMADARLLGPVRWLARSALTDGRCRSTVTPSLFFPGFDPTPIGGFSLGRWGFEVGAKIADALD
jgi:indole-3-pyruvate monooxygenase